MGGEVNQALKSARVGYYDAQAEHHRSIHRGPIARDSIFELLEKEELPVEDVPRTLYGVQNALWLIVALAFLQPPVLRLGRGERPLIDVEFLVWAFGGLGTTVQVLGLTLVAAPLTYLLLVVASQGWIAKATREMLFRVLECLHLVWTCRWIVRTTLPPPAAFFVVMQTVVTFLKIHSFYFEVRKLDDEKSAEHTLRGRDFLYFLVAPTLVYEPSGYPKTEHIRIRFLVRKTGSAIGLLLVLFLLITEFFLPVFREARTISLFEFVIRLIVPCAVFLLAVFFFTFEVLLNVAGELTCFADRSFYMDWWNAGSMDEFSRKWNKPVHEWLRRYIYKASQRAGYTRAMALTGTILFSAIFHELVLAVTFRRARIYLLSLMMLQMPLIWAFSGRFLDRTGRRFANVVFWFSMFVGPAILSMLYAREWYIEIYDE